MTAGRRNRRVTFQRFTTTETEMGGEIEDWADYATAFARVVHGSGQERREAAQESASVTATFYVLRNALTAGLTPKDRISWEGYWDIVSAVPSLQFNREMEVTATRAAD